MSNVRLVRMPAGLVDGPFLRRGVNQLGMIGGLF